MRKRSLRLYGFRNARAAAVAGDGIEKKTVFIRTGSGQFNDSAHGLQSGKQRGDFFISYRFYLGTYRLFIILGSIADRAIYRIPYDMA